MITSNPEELERFPKQSLTKAIIGVGKYIVIYVCLFIMLFYCTKCRGLFIYLFIFCSFENINIVKYRYI